MPDVVADRPVAVDLPDLRMVVVDGGHDRVRRRQVAELAGKRDLGVGVEVLSGEDQDLVGEQQ